MAIKILLDAGHYAKYNAGAISGYYESDMVWELHKYLKTELESYGFEVGVTRADKDKDLEVYERGQKAKGYDLFLSLHSNATTSEPTKRVVVIPPISGKGDGLAQLLADCVLNTMNLTKDKYWYTQIYKRKYSIFKPKTDYYGVIRGAVAAGVVGIIIEHSFHTNKEACRWLMDSANLKKLAAAEAKTLAEYYGMKKSETVKPAQSSNPSASINEGDLVKVSAGAEWTSGKPVPLFVLKDTWYVKSVKGSRVVIDKNKAGNNSIMSPIDAKYLTVVESEKKSVTEIAREVIAGKWYTGAARKSALTKAGYDYDAVQAEVNRLMK